MVLIHVFNKRQLPEIIDQLVFLVSHTGKLFEAILKDHILQHPSTQNVINRSQRAMRSYLTHWLEFLEYAMSQLDSGKPVVLFIKIFKRLLIKSLTIGYKIR